jgi:hypothetical protein
VPEVPGHRDIVDVREPDPLLRGSGEMALFGDVFQAGEIHH